MYPFDFPSSIDFDRMMARQLEPPYNPRVRGDMDTKFVPSNYNKLEVPYPHNPDKCIRNCRAIDV